MPKGLHPPSSVLSKPLWIPDFLYLPLFGKSHMAPFLFLFLFLRMILTCRIMNPFLSACIRSDMVLSKVYRRFMFQHSDSISAVRGLWTLIRDAHARSLSAKCYIKLHLLWFGRKSPVSACQLISQASISVLHVSVFCITVFISLFCI